jgi:hypothetical protein
LVECWIREATGKLRLVVEAAPRVLSPAILLPLPLASDRELVERFEREALSSPVGAGGTVLDHIAALERAASVADKAVAGLCRKLSPQTVETLAKSLEELRNALELLPTSPIIHVIKEEPN